jgi:fatty acid desaturase
MSALRFRTDWIALIYLACATGLFFLQWSLAEVHVPLVVLSCAMAYGTGCILHNHAHLSMWNNKLLNVLTDYWLVLLRGDGAYSWQPTHVNNHHRFSNHPGDMTLTYRFSEHNNVWNLIRYTALGGVLYVGSVFGYVASFRVRQPRRFWYLLSQMLLHWVFLAAAVFIDLEKAFIFVGVPQFFGYIAMVSTGYFQHHHADEHSEFNFARNFTGRLNNWMHFNHGYHTVHHINQSLHWTEWPSAHRAVEHEMDSDLNDNNLPWYMVRTLLLAPFFPSLGSRNFRAERQEAALFSSV